MNLDVVGLRKTVYEALGLVWTSRMVLRAKAGDSHYDPSIGENVSGSPVDYPVLGAEENYDSRYMTGSNVQEGDVFVTIAAEGLPIVPENGMNLFLGPVADPNTTPWGEIQDVRKYRLNGVFLGFTLHVRGAT